MFSQYREQFAELIFYADRNRRHRQPQTRINSSGSMTSTTRALRMTRCLLVLVISLNKQNRLSSLKMAAGAQAEIS